VDEPQVALKKITGRFIRNIQTVRVFNEQIGPVADEHDRSVLQQFVDDMNELIPELEEAEGSTLARRVIHSGPEPRTGLRFSCVVGWGWVAEICGRVGGCARPLEKSATNLRNTSIHRLSSW
jgi:hypothetical protein